MNRQHRADTARWDEWVPEARLLKLNEQGFAKRKQLLEQQTKKARPGASTSSPAVKDKGKGKKAAAAEAKKRARDSGIESVSRHAPTRETCTDHSCRSQST